MDFTEMAAIIKNRLDQSRYEHVMSVVETASQLGEHLGLDVTRLRLAALLHDCAKHLSFSQLKDFAERHQIPLSREDFLAEAVIHARVGAYIAQTEFGVKDQEVLEAIRVHPTGKPGMNIYARALFVCDFIEPRRSFKKQEKISHLAWEDFEQAVLAVAAEKNRWVLKKRGRLHQDGIDFYHDQRQRCSI